jgi:hypothetical protein
LKRFPLWALGLWLVAACIVLAVLNCGRHSLPEQTRPGPEGRQIAGVEAYTNEQQWQRTPWFRVSDVVMDWPVFVLIDYTGNACLVPARVWAIAKAGDFWPCPSGWRFARP